jgi:hypothetical protein
MRTRRVLGVLLASLIGCSAAAGDGAEGGGQAVTQGDPPSAAEAKACEEGLSWLPASSVAPPGVTPPSGTRGAVR